MIYLNHLFDPSSHKDIISNSFFLDDYIDCKSYSNAVIVPPTRFDDGIIGGVFDNGTLVPNTIDPCYSAKQTINESVEFSPNNSNVIYIGYFVKCWGHFISDCLRYMWFLKKCSFSDYNIVYIADENFELKGNYRRLLELLGIDVNKIIRIKTPTKFNKCIVPDSSFIYDRKLDKYFYRREYKETIEIIKRKFSINRAPNKKIYYSYSSFVKNKQNGIKKQFNEEALEDFFRKNGFLIIKPERLPLDEQLKLLSDCKCFASTEGSSSHNSVFLPANSTAIIIPRGPYKSGYQDVLNHVNEIETYYVDSSLSILTNEKTPWTGPFYYYVSEKLTSFFNIDYYKKYSKKSLKGFYKYFLYGLLLKRSGNYTINNIYGIKLLSLLSEKERRSVSKKILNKLINHR